MATFMTLGRYSVQGAEAIKAEGMTARKKFVASFVEGYGQKLVGYWGIRESDWDFVIVTEGPDVGPAQQLAMQVAAKSSGHFDDNRFYCLAETEDLDAAIGKAADQFRPPGAS